MSETLATVRLATGDDGVRADVETELDHAELAEILYLVADEMSGADRPRAAGSWGYQG